MKWMYVAIAACFYIPVAGQSAVWYREGEKAEVQWIAPNSSYHKTGIANKLLMGKNYRKIWAQPVRLPVFYLSRSGLEIVRPGGSKQTNSLYLRDAEGKQWVLRSVDKDARRGVPGVFRWSPFAGYKQQLITAIHPYAAAVTAPLMQAAGITAPNPVYFYVADDTALGPYRQRFAHTMMMLEKVDLAPKGAVFKTDTVLQLVKEGKAKVDAKNYLKARLVDMVIGDWDRHAGNWLWWASSQKNGIITFQPIPRDRDHALFDVDGIIPFLAKQTLEPHLVGFKAPPMKLAKLNRKALMLDKTFLADLDANNWEKITDDVVDLLEDEVMERAVMYMPADLSLEHKQTIKNMMIQRLEQLPRVILSYRQYLVR